MSQFWKPILNTLPYRATGYRPKQPRALPWAKSFCPFRACGAKFAKLQLFVRPPKSPVFFSLRAYHFLRGLNLVNDCSKCHEIRNICTL